jgi:AcrR family transcriptional regulator
MATDTRQRLIDAAKDRFYRDGFRNVGIDAILTDVGISKAAFYKHFESKDELMVAVLEDVDRFLQQQFRQMVKQRGGPAAAGQLRAVLDVVQQVIEEDGFHGCIFVNAVMEFPLPHDPAHQAAGRHKHAIEEFVFELAERAGAKDPAALAQELGLVIEGAYVTRSISGDPASFAVARRLAQRVIDQHLRQT